MFCENLQFNLSLYSDDVLTTEERAALDEHLVQCPLCRQKLSDFQALRNNLRVLSRPEFSAEMLNKVRTIVAEELYAVETKPVFLFSDTVQNWVQMRLMPYSVGTVASLILGFSLLWSLFSGLPGLEQNGGFAANNVRDNSPIFIANSDPKRINGDYAADEFPEPNRLFAAV
jgi:anti-sigma factor RsiW